MILRAVSVGFQVSLPEEFRCQNRHAAGRLVKPNDSVGKRGDDDQVLSHIEQAGGIWQFIIPPFSGGQSARHAESARLSCPDIPPDNVTGFDFGQPYTILVNRHS